MSNKKGYSENYTISRVSSRIIVLAFIACFVNHIVGAKHPNLIKNTKKHAVPKPASAAAQPAVKLVPQPAPAAPVQQAVPAYAQNTAPVPAAQAASTESFAGDDAPAVAAPQQAAQPARPPLEAAGIENAELVSAPEPVAAVPAVPAPASAAARPAVAKSVTRKKQPVSHEAAVAKATDPLIEKMDKLATGSSKIEGMKEEAVKIKDCEHRYEIVKTPMKTTLMEIINNIFTTGTIPIRESSRGFIVPSNFKIDTEVDSEASITVSNCKEDNKFIRFENFRTETTVSPTKWLKLEETVITLLEFRYDHMIKKSNGTIWNAMTISGTARGRIGEDGTELNNKKHTVVFSKPMRNDDHEAVDSDIEIKVHNTVRDRYEMRATDFLAMLGKGADDIYKATNPNRLDCLTNEDLAVAQRNGDDAIIRGEIAGPDIYSVYATGEAKYCDELPGSEIYIICQYDFTFNTNCALVAIIDTAGDSQMEAFEDSPLNNIGSISLTSLAKTANVFNGRVPERFVFQTAKNPMDNLNKDLSEKLAPYIANKDKRDHESPTPPDVIDDFCFRYKMHNIGSKYPNLKNALVSMLVEACPRANNITFYLPDIGLVAIDQIPLLMTSYEDESKFRQFFRGGRLAIESIEVRESDSESGAFQYVFRVQPPRQTNERSFAFLASFPFIKVEDNDFTMTRDITPDISFSGSGEEKILGNIANFMFEQDDLGTLMTVNLFSTSNIFLMKSLQEVPNFNFVEEEFDNFTFITPFMPMRQVFLPRLGLSVHVGDEDVRINGDALMGNESNVEFELHLTSEGDDTVKGRSCLFKRNGIFSDFINDARGDDFVGQTWLKYRTLALMYLPSLISKQDKCKMDPCCISEPEDGWVVDEEAVATGVKLVDIGVDHCRGHKNGSKACQFLAHAFPGRASIDIILTGVMTPNKLHLVGKTDNDMILGPDVLVSGTPPIEFTYVVKNSKKQKKDYATLIGWMTFKNNRANYFYTKLTIAGENVLMKILSGVENNMAMPDVFSTPFESLADTSSRQICLDGIKDVTEILINAPVKIGYHSEDQLLFDSPKLVRIFLNPTTGKVSRYYACRSSKNPVPIRELLTAFNGKHVFGLMDKTEVKSLCVTYHNRKKNWNITELGMIAKPGVHLSGLIASHFGKPHPRGETFHLRADMDLNISSTTSLFCVQMPSVLRWGVQERTIDGVKIETSAVNMHFNKDAQTQGPKYCFRLPKQSDGQTEAYIEGYIKSFAFEGPAIVKITNPDDRFPGNLFRYTIDYEGKLFNEIEGRIHMRADYNGQDPFLINFKVTVEQLKLKNIPEHVTEYANARLVMTDGLLTQAKNYHKKFKDWIEDVKQTSTQLSKKVKSQKEKFNKVKLERSRSIQAFKKECSAECGYVRIPGLKVEEQCSKTSNGRSLKCVKYAEDAHVASNVGCVASCEAERVKSNEEAIKLDVVTRVDGSNLDKTRNCQTIARRLQEKLAVIENYLSKNQDKFQNKLDKFKSLGDLEAAKFKLFNLHIETMVNDIHDTRCLKMNWESNWAWNKTSDLEWGVTKRHQVFTNLTRCFNGFFAKNLTEYALNSRYVVTILKKLEEQVNAVEGKYIRFDKVLAKNGTNKLSRQINKLEKELNECHNGTKDATVQTRSVIENMTPLKGGMFTIFQESTVDAFTKRSPWQIAKRKDAMKSFMNSGDRVKADQSPNTHDESSCSAARRATIDYSDIAHYVRHWVKGQQSAKRTLDSVKSTLNSEIQKADKKVGLFKKNMSSDVQELVSYWSGRAKLGMSTWILAEEERISKHNNDSLPFIRQELEYMYTSKEYPTLEDFFNQRSTLATNALKKANIATPDGNSFLDLQKNLLSLLQSRQSLTEIATPIENTIQRIDGLQKRTILCSS